MKYSTKLKHLGGTDPFLAIKTLSGRMFEIFRYLQTVAVSSQSVLILGETGVGKELIAQALHKASGLDGPLVAINVAGLDGTMFSDTLFGHIRGAYSDAISTRHGLVAGAQGGTLFLDEIGDLDQESQTKLLRVLQERVYYPLGADVTRPTNARIVCATHCNLKDKMTQGLFRADLYYRLSSHQVSIPPLRERIEDIALLSKHFVVESAYALNKPIPRIPDELLKRLEAYHFPGNVRELQALIHDAVACCSDGVVSLETIEIKFQNTDHLSKGMGLSRWHENNNMFSTISGPLPTFKEVELALLDEALRRSNGKQGVAAAMLGISRTALNRRIQVARKNRNRSDPPPH